MRLTPVSYKKLNESTPKWLFEISAHYQVQNERIHSFVFVCYLVRCGIRVSCINNKHSVRFLLHFIYFFLDEPYFFYLFTSQNSPFVIDVPEELEQYDQAQEMNNQAVISENNEIKPDASENKPTQYASTVSQDEKNYLVDYLHSYVIALCIKFRISILFLLSSDLL